MSDQQAYRVRMTRKVSRTVWLDQHADLWIVAPSKEAALEAAREMAHESSPEDIDEWVTEWRDSDSSRQATNDELDRPRPYKPPEMHDVDGPFMRDGWMELTYQMVTGIDPGEES